MKMKLAQKWIDLGWEESDRYTFESYVRLYPDRVLHLVTRTPSRTMWVANVYKNDIPTVSTLHKTLAKALRSFYP